MAMISRVRRLVNPGKKRKLSPLQKMFFGSKRQRAAVKRTTASRKRTVKAKVGSHWANKFTHGKRHKANVGSIITVWPKGNPGVRRKKYKRNGAKNRLVIVNPGARMAKGSSGRVISGYGSTVMNKGRKKNMAIRRRRRVSGKRRVVRRRRSPRVNVGRRYTRRRVARRNPGVRHYRRHRVGGRRVGRRSYRRNPGSGMLTGTAGRVLGVVGGVAVTKLLCGFLPASMATGVLGYLATGAVAVLQGKLVAKFAKSPALGNDMMVGGLAYLTAKVLNDFFPSIGAYTGMAGMGMIGGNSYYVPQVNQAGSMGKFLIPPAVSGYVAGAIPMQTAKGVGNMRRTGRLM